MHDPVTVLATLFRNFDEFANGAATRPGGKTLSTKRESVLYELCLSEKGCLCRWLQNMSYSRLFVGNAVGEPALADLSDIESRKIRNVIQ